MTTIETILLWYSCIMSTLVLVLTITRRTAKPAAKTMVTTKPRPKKSEFEFFLEENGIKKYFAIKKVEWLPKNFPISLVGSEEELLKLIDKYPRIYLEDTITAVSSLEPPKYMCVGTEGNVEKDYNKYTGSPVPRSFHKILVRCE